MLRRSLPNSRAVIFAVALLAVTLNALLPLAHAAAMPGDPIDRSMWSAICSVDGAETAGRDAGMTGEPHGCCLGLPHGWVLAAPVAVSMAIAPLGEPSRSITGAERPLAAGIRDGPSQPRAPPLLA